MAIEPREGEEVDPNAPPEDVGTAETQPGQTEVVAGTPEHEALLKANPNASSYAPEVNVVLPPEPEPEPEPEAEFEPQREDESDYDFEQRRREYEQRGGR